MSDSQKSKRRRLERSDIGMASELHSSFSRVCSTIRDLTEANGCIVLHTDEKREYRNVLKANGLLEKRVKHLTTSSRKARTFQNPLWAVNYYDREIRKDQANHVRQTTRWSREANNCMERMYMYAGYHNFFKPYRIKQRDMRSHAEVAGVDAGVIRPLRRTFFTLRYFFSRLAPNPSEWRVWLRAYRTPFHSAFQALPAYVTGQQRHAPMVQAA